jgi:hypothetical protein
MDAAAVRTPGGLDVAGILQRHQVGWAPFAIGFTGFDAIATAMWVALGIAIEANPWLAWLIDEAGVAPAMLARATIGIGLVLSLDALRPRSKTARRALPVITAVLGTVAVWQLVGPVLSSP